MSKLKITIAALSVFAFGLLTACGDGFKATGDAQNNLEQIKQAAEEAPPAETESSVLEDAVARFQSQVDRLEQQNPGINEGFVSSLRGLTLLRTDSFDGQSSTNTNLTLTIKTSCDSSSDVRLSNFVSLDSLRDGQDIQLDNSNPTYRAIVRCTDVDDQNNIGCNELVVTIERNGPNGLTGTAHFAMGGRMTRSEDFGDLYEYNAVQPRQSIANFFELDSVAEARDVCADEDASATLGDSGSGNASDDIFDNHVDRNGIAPTNEVDDMFINIDNSGWERPSTGTQQEETNWDDFGTWL